jgi:hypothetical protein
LKLIYSFGIFCISFQFLSLSHAMKPLDSGLASDLAFYSQELEVSSSAPAKEIFHGIAREAVEASLVHGLFFKNDRFVFCQREPHSYAHKAFYKCSVYLKMNGLGELSNYETDSDYGKGDTVEAIITKPVKGIGNLVPTISGLKIEVTGDLANFLYKKMSKIYVDYDESEDSIVEVKRGVNIFCAKISSKEKQGTIQKVETKCSVNIKLNGDQKARENYPELSETTPDNSYISKKTY